MRLTALVFVFVMILAVGSVPYAIGQTLTTITNVWTTTGFYTSNVYSTNTVGTTTEMVVSENTFVSTTDTLVPAQGTHECYFDHWNITVNPGTLEITGTIGPPSEKIDFFIMNQNQFYDFWHYGGCTSGPFSAEVAVYGLTSTYSLDWTNPPPGWYYFIFYSEAVGTNLVTVITPFVLVATYNQAQTSTVYNEVTNQMTGTETQIVTSLQATQVASSIGSGLNLGIIAGIVVVVVVLVAALYFVKSRPKSQGGKQEATLRKKTDDESLCSNCGKPLPVGSKFCNKCGATQE